MDRDAIRTERRSMTLVTLLIVGGFLFTAGCGGAPTATANAQPVAAQGAAPAVAKTSAAAEKPVNLDACSLLTKEEVGEAIGKPVTPIVESTGTAASCAYHDATHQPNKFLGLIVYAVTPSEARGAFEAMKSSERKQVAVPGIGDDAYWDETFGLHVVKGGYEIGISVSEPGVDELKAARTLAPKVLSRLP